MRRFLLLLALLALGALIALVGLLPRQSKQALSPLAETPARSVASTDPQPPALDGREADAADSIGATASAPAAVVQNGDESKPFGVQGRVRLKDDRTPVPGACVEIAYFDTQGDAERVRYLRKSKASETSLMEMATTSSTGEYLIELPARALLVSIRVRQGHWSPSSGMPQTLELKRSLGLHELTGVERLDLVLRTALSLSGRVLDENTHAPIAGAEIRCWGPRCDGSTSTDASGSFTCNWIKLDPSESPASAWRVVASHADYPPREYSFPEVGVDDAIPDMTLMLQHGITVAGTVTGADKKPLRGVELMLLPTIDAPSAEVHEVSGVFRATSGDRGGFRFTGVPRFDYAWLVAEPQQRDPILWSGEQRMLLDAATDDLDKVSVHVELQTSVEVEATFPDGVPATRQQLCLMRVEGRGELFVPSTSVWLPCPVGRPVHIVAIAMKRPDRSDAEVFRGDLTGTFELNRSDAVRVPIELHSQGASRASSGEDLGGLGEQGNPWSRTLVSVHLLESGAAGARSVLDGFGLPMTGWDFQPFANTREIVVGGDPGWRRFRFSAPGHRTRYYEMLLKAGDSPRLDIPLLRLP